MTCLNENDLDTHNSGYYKRKEEDNTENGIVFCIIMLFGLVVILAAVLSGGLR